VALGIDDVIEPQNPDTSVCYTQRYTCTVKKTYSEKNTNLDYKIPGSIKLEQWPIK